jgi:hypothetical protein
MALRVRDGDPPVREEQTMDGSIIVASTGPTSPGRLCGLPRSSLTGWACVW